MLVVAYFSEGTPYEREADLLRASLERVGMPHRIDPVPDRGGWYANTAYKAEFLGAVREEESGPLLYLDVDAVVHASCECYFDRLGTRGIDFGAHWFRGPARKPTGREVTREMPRMLSGTLFLGDTAGCRALLSNWRALNELWRSRGIVQGGGQKNLWFTLTCMPGLRTERLSGRYCRVFDKPWAYDPNEPVVIEHTIASRDNRGPKRNGSSRVARLIELRREYEVGP